MWIRIILILSFAIISGFITEAGAGASLPVYLPPVTNEVSGKDSNESADISGVIMEAFSSEAVKDFQVQLGAFKSESNANKYLYEMQSYFGSNVLMIEEGGYYKIRLTEASDSKGRILYYDPAAIIGNDVAEQEEPMAVLTTFQTEEYFQEDDSLVFSGEISDSIQAGDTVLTGIADTLYHFDTTSVMAVHELPDTTEMTVSADSEQPVIEKPRFFILNFESPWLKRINYFGKSFALVNALIITIMISIGTMIILLMVILLNRTRMEKEEKLRQYLSERYQTLIIDYLFGDATPEKFFPIASNTYRRQVLIDQMIDVSVNLKGDAEQKLIALYLDLGLDNDSIKRAHDHRWHKKIKGFRELAFMNIKDANSAMIKALDSKNEILRMEAQIALVRLSDDDPFEFLSSMTRPFSLWEQITLHELIIQHDITVPAFKKWLTSPNPTIVMFALRMIREFRQTEAEEEVRETLFYPSPEVRHLAVQVAGDLNMRSSLEIMKSMYKNQDYNTCLEIIKSMGKMPDTAYMGFLKLVLDKEDDVQLQIEATKAMENMGEEGVKALVKLMKSEYKNYNIIVRHVLDRRIF